MMCFNFFKAECPVEYIQYGAFFFLPKMDIDTRLTLINRFRTSLIGVLHRRSFPPPFSCSSTRPSTHRTRPEASRRS